jgi:5-methylcytosine-specific restriction protein A
MSSTTRSEEAREWRHLYDSVAWSNLRAWQLRNHPLCERCRIEGRVTAATVVNHRIPHKGVAALFFNSTNLESSCKPHHDGAIQSFERTGIERGCDVDGNPRAVRLGWHEGMPKGGDRG